MVEVNGGGFGHVEKGGHPTLLHAHNSSVGSTSVCVGGENTYNCVGVVNNGQR